MPVITQSNISLAVLLSPDTTSRNVIQARNTSTVPLTIKLVSGSSQDMFQLQYSDGTVIGKFFSATDAYIPTVVSAKPTVLSLFTPDINSACGIKFMRSDGGTGAYIYHNGNNYTVHFGFNVFNGSKLYFDAYAGNAVMIDENGQSNFYATAATRVPVTIKGFASQSGNLTEWQKSDATKCTYISATSELMSDGYATNTFTAGTGSSLTTTRGVESVFIGAVAGLSCTGGNNTFVGSRSGRTITTGTQNTGLGAYSVAGTAGAGTSATDNTGIGFSALTGLTSGGENTAVGRNAGFILTTGTRNTILGAYATVTANNVTGAIAIGYETTSAANTFVAGSTSQSITNVYFGKGITHATPVAYTINGTGGSGTDIAGANIGIAGGQGTGTGVGGSIILQIAPAAGSTSSTLNSLVTVLTIDSTKKFTLGSGAKIIGLVGTNEVCQGRLTLESGVPVSATDQTAKTTMYFTPHDGNVVTLYDGTNWVPYTFSELSLALGTLTSDKNYDVFLYDNSGTLTLEFLVWTSDTVRATALATQDGILVKTGATGRRYLGTFRTTATTTTEDSLAKRFVYNHYNQIERPMKAVDTTDSWTYTTFTWREARAQTTNQIAFVCGNPNHGHNMIDAHVTATTSQSGANKRAVGVGLNSTTTPHADCIYGLTNNASYINLVSTLKTIPVTGYNFAAWLEISSVTGTTTWYGDDGGNCQSGIIGSILM